MKNKLLFLSLISISLIACNADTKSNQKLILGTWIPQRLDAMKIDQRLIFLENNIAVNVTQNEQPDANDSVTYKLSGDGKFLFTTEKNGRVEELKIIKLTEHEMVLLIKGNDDKNDTLKLKKE